MFLVLFHSERVVDLLILAKEALLRQKELTNNHEYIFINQSKNPFYSHDIIGLNFRKILKKWNKRKTNI